MRGEELFGPDTCLVEASAALVDERLYPEEVAAVAGSVQSRRAEFGTARVCAREALARLGLPGGPLPALASGAPAWPAGAVGSIAHTHGHCAVVVGRRPPLCSLGLDVELLRPLDAGVLGIILTARERAWLDDQPADRRQDLAMTVFSAKEAYYKCQYPVTGAFLEFADVEVDLRPDLGAFEVRMIAPPPSPELARLRGRFAFASGRVMCGVELRGV